MHIKDHARAEGWFRRHAAAPSSKGAWKAFVARNNRPQEPRTMAQGGRIGLKPGGLVEPGVGYYANKKGDPLPKEVKDFLIETFDDVEFDWGKGRYGFTKKDDTALYTKINEVVKKKLANPNYIFKPDLGSLKYEKGFGTGKQLLEKARSKGINAKEGRAASIFADNFNIKSQRNPLGGQIDKIYDLTALDNPKNIETIIKAQVQRGAATPEATEKYLSQDIKKDKKRKTQAKRKAAIKKHSVFHYETVKWAGNKKKKVHLSHMDDIYSQYMTGQTLGYASEKINKTFLDTYDHKFRALYEKRERLLKEKPKDLVKQLEQINIKGARLAGETGGYKSFKFLDPYTLKPYQFGVDSFKTIDPFNLLKGKKLKDIIIKGDPFNPKSKLIFDRSQISAEDEYFFEENRKRVLKTQIEVNPTKTIKNLKEKILSNYWCGQKQIAKAGGGRIGFAGSCPVEVKQKNFLRMTNDVSTRRVTGEAAKEIAEQAGKVVAKAGSKSALASIFGPAGIGLDIAYEVGSIGVDVAGGKSWNRALQDNWITGAFISGTGQEEFHKELSAKYPEAKPYGQAQDLIVSYNNAQKTIDFVKQSNYRAPGQKEEALRVAERDLRGIEAQYNALTKHGKIMEEGSNEYENYMAAKTEFEDAAKAKSYASEQKLKYQLDPPKSDRAISSQRGEPVKIDFSLPQNYTTFKPDLPTREDLNKIWQDQGFEGTVPADSAKEFITGEKWRQEFEQPGIRGTQDWRGAKGGLAGLMKKYYD